MPRAILLGDPRPYKVFGQFAGLPFWLGSLTLLAAAPGVGKTSWLLRMVSEAAAAGFPAALGCYEHTPEELKYRLRRQVEAVVAGAHGKADEFELEKELVRSSQAVLLGLSDREDTIRGLEEILLADYDFPEEGPALLAMDYLQRVPLVGLTGLIPEDQRSGAAAAGLRALARRHGWAVVTACALRAESFGSGDSLTVLLGDERLAYESDRVLLVRRQGSVKSCGCVALEVHTLKDRTGPAQSFTFVFWGARMYPATDVGEIECESSDWNT